MACCEDHRKACEKLERQLLEYVRADKAGARFQSIERPEFGEFYRPIGLSTAIGIPSFGRYYMQISYLKVSDDAFLMIFGDVSSNYFSAALYLKRKEGHVELRETIGDDNPWPDFQFDDEDVAKRVSMEREQFENLIDQLSVVGRNKRSDVPAMK